MLRKLIRYEFLATGRIFLPLYGAFVLISLIMRGAIQIQNIWRIEENSFMNLLMVIPMLLYVGMFVATVVGTILIAISRFYKNLLSEEGYLTFTLPAKVWQLVVSKLIPAMVWSIASGLVCIVSIFILGYDPNTFNVVVEVWDQIVWGFSQGGVVINMGLLLEFLLVMLTKFVVPVYIHLRGDCRHQFRQPSSGADGNWRVYRHYDCESDNQHGSDLHSDGDVSDVLYRSYHGFSAEWICPWNFVAEHGGFPFHVRCDVCRHQCDFEEKTESCLIRRPAVRSTDCGPFPMV